MQQYLWSIGPPQAPTQSSGILSRLFPLSVQHLRLACCCVSVGFSAGEKQKDASAWSSSHLWSSSRRDGEMKSELGLSGLGEGRVRSGLASSLCRSIVPAAPLSELIPSTQKATHIFPGHSQARQMEIITECGQDHFFSPQSRKGAAHPWVTPVSWVCFPHQV